MSRLFLSSMSLPGFQEDYGLGYGVRWEVTSIRSVCESFSNIHMSSKSLPGVWEDLDIPDGPGDDVRWEGTSIRSFCESFIKFQLVLAYLEMI